MCVLNSVYKLFSKLCIHFNKVNQLRAFKDKREKLRDIRNLEERLLLDNLEDTERKLGDSPRSPRRTRSRLPLSRHPEVRDLQIEVRIIRYKQ